MAFTLSNLIESTLRSLGQVEDVIATGGSTNTVAATMLGDKFGDDDLNNGMIIVTYDAGGAGAAPEGEFSRISGYVQSTNTITVDTALTAAPAAGDKIAIGKSFYPLATMIQLANDALLEMGDILLVDESLTASVSQTEYGWAVAWKRRSPLKIQIKTSSATSDGQWVDLVDWYVAPGAPGSAGKIIMRDYPPYAMALKIWYVGSHPKLTAFSSVISESFQPATVVAILRKKALEWQNNRTSGSDPAIIQALNASMVDAQQKTREMPSSMRKRQPTLFKAPVIYPD